MHGSQVKRLQRHRLDSHGRERSPDSQRRFLSGAASRQEQSHSFGPQTTKRELEHRPRRLVEPLNVVDGDHQGHPRAHLSLHTQERRRDDPIAQWWSRWLVDQQRGPQRSPLRRGQRRQRLIQVVPEQVGHGRERQLRLCRHRAASPHAMTSRLREKAPRCGAFSSCAREDSNLHGPFSPQGPQPRSRRVDALSSVQIGQIVRFAGRIGRNGRGGCCHGCCHAGRGFRQRSWRRKLAQRRLSHGRELGGSFTTWSATGRALPRGSRCPRCRCSPRLPSCLSARRSAATPLTGGTTAQSSSRRSAAGRSSRRRRWRVDITASESGSASIGDRGQPSAQDAGVAE
jgi:hypothetical protein